MSADKGILRLSKKGVVQIEFVSKKGKTVLVTPSQEEISHTLQKRLKELDGKEVEFEHIAGQPKSVREVGGTFVPAAARDASSGGRQQRGQRPSSPPQRQRDGVGGREGDGAQRHFHNPYNFIPAPPRNSSDPELGDHPPTSQDSFDPARYSGRIRIRMVAQTPLLVPETDNPKPESDSNDHETFDLRQDTDGKPSIPASSVRGMLRSAYEAVTNSRFGKFSKDHKSQITYRQSQKPYKKVAYPRSPWDLIMDSLLLPATVLAELSPADRVFGWVRPDSDDTSAQGRGARRGLLRVGPVTCTSAVDDAVEEFSPPGVPLAILSTPKPQQGRFYVARTPAGEAQGDGLSKEEAGYASGKGLRGRKVYPHHRTLPTNHWQDPMECRTRRPVGSPAHYQEYRRPRQRDGTEQRDDQNRSILGWVKPGAEFRFDVRIHNLSKVEFGALVWVLSLPDEHYLRFGGGKPLGFGSVRLEIETCDVRHGDELRDRYSSWTPSASGTDHRQDTVEAFRQAVVRAHPVHGDGGFEEVSFIRAFIAACQGFGDNLPIHYPRATDDGQPGPPPPEGESFWWFVANEQSRARYALRDLVGDKGLPTLRPPRGRGGSSKGGQGQRGRFRGRGRR